MKNSLLLALLALPCFMFSQLKIEGQIGGANFVGYSINTELDIKLFKNKDHYLMPSLGVGSVLPYISIPA